MIDGELKPMTQIPQLSAWTQWMQDVRKMSSHTVKAYEADVRNFLAFQNAHHGQILTIDDICVLTLRDFRAWLVQRASEGYENRSTARALSVIRAFFRYLAK